MFVYFIKEERSGLIKIGYSENPQKRLKALQTGQAKDLEIIMTVKGGAELESVLHKAFDFFRVRGEWFLLKRPQIEQAANIAIRHTITHSKKEYYYPDKEEVAIKTDHDEIKRPDTLEMEERPGAVSLIFRWIYNALYLREFDTETIFASEKNFGKRTVYLHTKTLEDTWTLCMPKEMKPSQRTIHESMKWVAPSRTKISGFGDGVRRNVRVVSREEFEAWFRNNNRNGLNLDAALDRLAESRPSSVQIKSPLDAPASVG
jgi:hypothetical protein